MATTPQIQSDGHARAMWRRCLASAFRTAFACAIVGVATLYGPKILNRQVAFPAFSYVTVILIVTDATLGDTLRGCWLALLATVQGVCPSILGLWLIGPARLTTSTTAAVVAVSAFMVALPENTHLISKRIALGQIVIVYVIAFDNGAKTEPVMHPVHVAASTAVGAAACVLALLLPFPSLACFEVRENCRLYVENACERLKLFVKAFSAEDKTSPKAFISQAKSFHKSGNKLLQTIKSKQESMEWEIIPIKFIKSTYNQNPAQTLQFIDTILRGMQNALQNISHFPVGLLNNSEIKNDFITLEEQILNKVKSMALENSILPQSDIEMDKKFHQTLQITNSTIPLISLKNLPSLFFIFCLKLLQTKPQTKQAPNHDSQKNKESFLPKLWSNYRSSVNITINKKRLMPALKCSISLGSAVLFGLIYSKENGIWSGLPVAISLAAAREATFKVANVKAQGTVLGTVYGVIGCFVFEKYVKIRFISLLPWFIFSSFLRQSKMYGQAGGVSAVIGAVLILGRKNFGTPSDFAIARIVETFIGLSCSIMVDILLQPTRASVMAKIQVSKSLQALHESVGSINLIGSSGKLIGLEESIRKLRFELNELGKYIEEAEVEPNFWFIPFNSAGYSKLRLSLSKMVDFLHFGGYALRFLEKESEKMDKLENDLKVLRDAICSGIKCFEEVSLVKSVAMLEREYEKRKNDLDDLEMGKSGKLCVIQWSGFDDDDEMRKSVNYFVEHLDEVVSEIGVEKDEMKNEVVLSLSSLVYCMDGMLKESKEIDKAIKDIVQWENPSVQVDLHAILCKLRALQKSVTNK